MLQTVLSLLTGVLGILVVMGGWFALQAIVRRRSGCGADQDVLDFMTHGCGGCKGSDVCRKRKKLRGGESPESGYENHELI